MIGTLVFSAILLLFFWQSILTFLLNTFIPWLLQTLGPIVADIFKKIVAFLDKSVTWTRQQIRKAWAWFRARVNTIETVYDLSDLSRILRVTTTIIPTPDGNFVKEVHKEVVSYNDLPADVRAEFIKIAQKNFTIDFKKQIEEKFSEQCDISEAELAQESVDDKKVIELLA